MLVSVSWLSVCVSVLSIASPMSSSSRAGVGCSARRGSMMVLFATCGIVSAISVSGLCRVFLVLSSVVVCAEFSGLNTLRL